MKWAVAGTGQISRSVIPDMRQAGFDIISVFSRSTEKAAAFAEEFSVDSATDSYAALLEDPEVEALYVATPIALHFDMTREALRAGKHVLVEKPMAATAAEVDELFALAKERGLFLMEGMWTKFNPVFRAVLDEIDAGTIGEVRTLRSSFASPIPEWMSSRWDMARSGGALLDQGIYSVMFAHALFGSPSSIHAEGTLRSDGLDLSAHVILGFDNGRYALSTTSMTEFSDSTAAIGGTRGWLTLPAMFWATHTLIIHAHDYTSMFENPEQRNLTRTGNGYVPMLRAVAEAIKEGLLEHPWHTAAHTSAVFHILDEIRRQLAVTHASLTAPTD